MYNSPQFFIKASSCSHLECSRTAITTVSHSETTGYASHNMGWLRQVPNRVMAWHGGRRASHSELYSVGEAPYPPATTTDFTRQLMYQVSSSLPLATRPHVVGPISVISSPACTGKVMRQVFCSCHIYRAREVAAVQLAALPTCGTRRRCCHILTPLAAPEVTDAPHTPCMRACACTPPNGNRPAQRAPGADSHHPNDMTCRPEVYKACGYADGWALVGGRTRIDFCACESGALASS